MIINMIGTRGAKIIVLFVLIVGISTPAQARPNLQENCSEYTNWVEERTGNFAVVYTPLTGPFAIGLLAQYSDDLENLYATFGQAFDESPTAPITIRIYPRDIEYYCLNPFPPNLSEGQSHSHISSQEIALIGSVLFADATIWQVKALNAMHYELTVLFVEKATDGNALPGLLAGTGLYAQNPLDIFPELYAASGLGDTPTMRWRDVWEAEDLSNAETSVQALSITAYLIDVYGWSQYVSFLHELKGTESYRQALRDVYGMSLSELEDHWQIYFPVYVAERWSVNVIHNYDLSVYEQLLDGSAYTDAKQGLEEAVKVIGYFSGNNLQTASVLLNLAEIGIEAGALAGEARQAIISGDYQRALITAESSLGLFAQLGDQTRFEEISVYSQTAQEVLDLRIELQELSQKDSLTDPTVMRDLERVGGRLAELGDVEGVQQTQEAIIIVSEKERYLTWGLGGLGIVLVLVLLLRQVLGFRKDSQQEALL